jgi:hypothetical protein
MRFICSVLNVTTPMVSFESLKPGDDVRDQRLGFRLVDARPTLLVLAIYVMEADGPVFGEWRWKRDQAAAIIAMVGERDQRFVPAAVMPGQIHRGQIRTHALVENAFQVAFDVLVVRRRFGAVEERGRRQLLRVADHHDLLAARHRTDRVPYRDLRCLVKYDYVESAGIRRQVLGNRQRAHQ